MKFLPALLLAVLSTTTFSQDYMFEIGAQAGPNITAMQFENELLQDNTQPKIAALGGLFFQYNLNTIFSLRVDPSFERLEYKYKDRTYTDQYGNTDGPYKTKINLDYITVPVLFKASIGNKINGFVNAGPSFNFLLQSKWTSEMPERTFKQLTTTQYNTFNLGLTTGLGVAIPLKETIALSFEVRNNLGLTNINKNDDSDYAIKTNSTSLLVGIAYKFGVKQ